MKQIVCCFLSFCLLMSAQENMDLGVVHRIKAEALGKKSKLSETLQTLTDRLGPRLTASPEYDAAADWAAGQLKTWGLTNVKLEKWGSFGRPWSLRRFSAHLLQPQYSPLIGFPMAWSGSTQGVQQMDPVYLPIRTNDMEHFAADIDKIEKEQKGKLQGKAVMVTRTRELELQMKAAARRYTDAELSTQAGAPDINIPSAKKFDYSKLALPEDPEERRAFTAGAPPAFREALREKTGELARRLHTVLRKEGAVAVLRSDARGDGGTVFAESAGWHKAQYPSPLPTAVLTFEHYNRMVRLLETKVPIKLELNIQAEIGTADKEATNIVAEIPGAAKAEELVLVGAHFDSWIGGTGATDNASGSAVALEAVRILKALNLKLDRTVRIILWSGEEQGLLGSKAYVKEHYGDPKTMQLTAEHAKVSAYFNLDNGSGKIRGVYLQGNDAARPVWERWLSPFRDQGVTTLSIRDTGGTDHLSFDAVGLPGFQFIQDPLEYGSRTHHSNMDVYDHTRPADLMQASAVMASVIYHAANRPELMPRKPLPEPQPKWEGSAETPSPSSGTK